jgi:ClpP class serine protease
MNFGEIFWILFIVMTFAPIIKQQVIERARFKLIRQIEQARQSRVITLIHRQESISLLGIPISRYINVEDSEQVLRAIRLTPDDMPIDIILHTPGGLVLAAEQIANALEKHPAKVSVFIPHYAMSGGTMIAMSADEIIMDDNAVLGPVDPQLGQYPAASLVKVTKMKNINRIDDNTLIMADMAEKALRQVKEFVYYLLEDNLGAEKAEELATMLTDGRWTHDYPITCDQAKEWGLNISIDFPTEVHLLMELYPQPAQRRPSVQFIPVPYGKETEKKS